MFKTNNNDLIDKKEFKCLISVLLHGIFGHWLH